MDLKDTIRTVPDFPIEGIQFRDITSMLESPHAFNKACVDLTKACMQFDATKIVAIESRGFIFGSPIARDMELPLILARKPGKLPGDVHSKEYELEYGKASLEIQTISDIKGNDIVVVVDDLIATGGTAIAVCDIIHNSYFVPKNNILTLAVIDLPDLGGFDKIHEHGYHTSVLIEFKGE